MSAAGWVVWWPRWSAGRCRALRHWARAVALPREVGTLIPPPRVLRHCALAPPAAPSPRAVREGLANLGRFAPRERGSLAVGNLNEEIEKDAAEHSVVVLANAGTHNHRGHNFAE